MPLTTPLPPIDFSALTFDFFELLEQTFKRLENGLPVVEIALDSADRAAEIEERFNYLAVRRNLPIFLPSRPFGLAPTGFLTISTSESLLIAIIGALRRTSCEIGGADIDLLIIDAESVYTQSNTFGVIQPNFTS